MTINNIIAQGVRPIGADVPQVLGMIQDRRMQQSRNALLERDMRMREANANALAEDRAQKQQRTKTEAALAQASWVAEKKPPKRAIEQQVEGVREGYERLNGPGSWDLATDEQVWQSAEESVMKLASSLGIGPPQPQQAAPSDFMQKYQEARAQGFQGSPLDFQKQWTAASRGPQQPQKPGYGEPKAGINPATGKPEMYVVDDDANTKWLGIAPQPQTASLRDELEADKVKGAKTRVSGNLAELRSYYTDLENLRAIVDTRRSGSENVSAAVRASGIGQLAGKALGTREQSARNKVNQMRPLLLQEIRQASQMGARGLDSNKELEFYLQAATDPARDIQSNIAAMQVLENAYGLGGKVAGVDEKLAGPLGQEFLKTLPRVSNDAEYAALASGSEFVDPNGKRRVKP